MKKFVLLCIGFLLVFSLSGCGGSLVDLNTPKSEQLSSKYDFYGDSMNNIRSTMGITPEQADEVFILLADNGLDGKVTSIIKNEQSGEPYYNVNWTGNTYRVFLSDGAVSKIEDSKTSKVIYPAPESSGPESSSAESETASTLEKAVDDAISAARAEKVKVEIVENFGTESKEDRNIEIYLSGKDNVSKKLIRSGMLIQANDILKALQPRSDIAQVCLFWSFPLTDSYGNTSEQNVMKILVKKDTLDKINFENFDWNKYPEIADDYYENAALSK
ncbi:hypothetical protein [Caproiciproducens sp. CPB-2]|uniref:hypothetical protein n=1 Tax=Caproiciproducens sp. CPB-2 TaxID=3030017 RepID=UPI0023D9A4D2|nr:hypothetical protein [Caproiciproducens sp. CPB-2]MDF1495470.1 hypothetical protein [Caproiciproducens sp. CPB-2]